MDQKISTDTSLEFQDFDLSTSGRDGARAYTADAGGVSDDDEDRLQGDIEQARLLGEAEDSDAAAATSTGSFLSFEFYQRFFDVSTAEVRQRCLWSMLPTPSRRLLADKLSSRPDLYGPFWICATLAVSIAVTGNLANYLQTASHGGAQQWKYDFHKLTLAGTVLFSYSWLIPVGMTTLFWWRSVKIGVSLMQLISLYGYSLTVFVPISVVCASGVSPVQWSAVLLGFALSGAVLAQNLWRAVTERGRSRRGGDASDDDESGAASSAGLRRLGVIMISVVLLLHLALSAGFVLYFFRTPLPPSVVGDPGSRPTVTPVTSTVSGGADATLDRHERTSPVHGHVQEGGRSRLPAASMTSREHHREGGPSQVPAASMTSRDHQRPESTPRQVSESERRGDTVVSRAGNKRTPERHTSAVEQTGNAAVIDGEIYKAREGHNDSRHSVQQ